MMQREDRPGQVRWTVWSVAAVLFFIAVFAACVVDDYRRAGAGDWPSCQGKIIERSIVRQQRAKETRFEHRVVYRYTAGGAERRGDRVAVEPVWYSDARTAKLDLEDQYTVGAPVTVYYDPKDPDQAVLRLTPMSWARSLATGLLVAVVAVTVVGVRVMRTRRLLGDG